MTDILFGQSYYLRFDHKLWEAMQPYPPLGTLYAASYMRERGYQVALFDAMLSDPDVNVRLAALDALAPRASRADERPRLISAVARQDSPLVQLSLVDVLLESADPAAQRDLEQLLDNPNLDPVVRGYLRDRIGRSL